MSKPFEWRDFTKKYTDLSTNGFPVLSKAGQVQDTIKVKFSSKAQKGVKVDSSFANYNATSTEADFSAKVNFDELKGVELGFKAKSKPSAEFTAKLDDKVIPVEGSSLTLKFAAQAPADQTLGATFGFANQLVNFNLGFSYPLHQRLFDFLDAPINEVNPLNNQSAKVDLDFVAKPLDTSDIYVGGNASINLPRENNELTYSSKLAVATNNKTFNGGLFVEHKKERKEIEDKDDKNKKVVTYAHATKYGGYAYTEVDDLSGGAQVTYDPTDKTSKYKGFGFEALFGIQRDADSKLTNKVQVIPDTIFSFALEQKLSPATKLSFGYSFLLNKTTAESKTKASAYNFGVELTH